MESVMKKRHAATAQALEELLVEGILSCAPVTEEITAETVRACEQHAEFILPTGAVNTLQPTAPAKKHG
jgi:hypothetical protein